MEKSTGVGIIVGLIVFSIVSVSSSKVFTDNQKLLLYVTLTLLFPLGLVLTGIFYLSNKSK